MTAADTYREPPQSRPALRTHWVTVGEVGTPIECHGQSQYECADFSNIARTNSCSAREKSRRAAVCDDSPRVLFAMCASEWWE